jgi:hypothetical protein
MKSIGFKNFFLNLYSTLKKKTHDPGHKLNRVQYFFPIKFIANVKQKTQTK